jgi:hypothetical protein
VRRVQSKKSHHRKKKYSSSDEDRHKSDEDYSYNKKEDGRIVRANVHVSVPTDLIKVYSSQIHFNHDSRDRQQRRAKDLIKLIELDKKSFNILDINPEEMHTVYSSHLKHVNT